jgi:hypothetical protein
MCKRARVCVCMIVCIIVRWNISSQGNYANVHTHKHKMKTHQPTPCTEHCGGIITGKTDNVSSRHKCVLYAKSTGPLTFDQLHTSKMNLITRDVLLEDYRRS